MRLRNKHHMHQLNYIRGSSIGSGSVISTSQLTSLFKGELNPKIKFVLFERTLEITE